MMLRAARILPGHDRGMCAVDAKETLGLLRVPKCASTSVTQRLGLEKWLKVAVVAPKPIIVAYREPISRFISSIPETLLRCRPEEAGLSGDVSVPPDVYEKLFQVDVGSPESLVAAILAIIEDGGFFDPHHEPQVNFLFDEDGNAFADYWMFDVSNTDRAIVQANTNWGVRPVSRRNRNTRSSQNLMKLLYGRSLRISQGLEKWKPSHGDMFYPKDHPIARIIGVSGTVPFRLAESRVGSYYRECLKSVNLDSGTTNRVVALYASDLKLVREATAATREESPFVRLSQLRAR